MKPTIVTLEKGKETKGTFRFDWPDPNTPITSLCVRNSAYEGSMVPKAIVLAVG